MTSPADAARAALQRAEDEVWEDYRKQEFRVREARLFPPREEWHGTLSGYNYRGCRCEECRAAWAEYNRARRADPDREIRHGTVSGYTGGCNCDRCRAAWNLYQREWRNRHRPGSYAHAHKCAECWEKQKSHNKISAQNRRVYYREHPEEIPAEKHGTNVGYTGYACRCQRCKDAHALSAREARRKKQ